MLVTRYNPNSQFSDFRRGFDILNTMLNELTVPNNNDRFQSDFNPSVNTREGEFAYHIEVDLPGMKKDDIDIQIEDNNLIISGERKIKKELKEENYYKIESSYGKFKRSFSLPEDVDLENIHASSTDGVLEVVVPKLEKEKIEKTKKIKIK
jgi:HSP20 family protein